MILKIKNKYLIFKTNKFWNNLLKNSFWAFIGESSASVLNLITVIILIKILGSNKNGILVLAQSYVSIMDVLINVQSWKSIIHFGEHCLINKNYDILNAYVKLGSILDITTAILCTFISLILINVAGSIFSINKEMIICSTILSLTIITHFSGTPTAILRIFNKFHFVALQKFIGSFIKFLSIYLCFYIFKIKDLYIVTFIYCITDMINNLLLVIFAVNVYKKNVGLKKLFKSKIPKDKKDFINYTIWGTITDIMDIPINYLDVFIISKLGNEFVSIFKVFKQCAAIFQKVASPLQQSIMPQFSALCASKKEKEGYAVVTKLHKYMISIVTPVACIFGVSSIFWLKILYGQLYAKYWYVLLLFLVVQTYALSYSTLHPYFLSLNQPKRSAIYVMIANIVYVLISLFLISKIGLMAMVIAAGIQSFIVIELKKIYINDNILYG